MEAGGMEAGGMEAGGMEAGGMETGGMDGLEARGSAIYSYWDDAGGSWTG